MHTHIKNLQFVQMYEEAESISALLHFCAKSRASKLKCGSWLSITKIQGLSLNAFVCLMKYFMMGGKNEEFIHSVGVASPWVPGGVFLIIWSLNIFLEKTIIGDANFPLATNYTACCNWSSSFSPCHFSNSLSPLRCNHFLLFLYCGSRSFVQINMYHKQRQDYGSTGFLSYYKIVRHCFY